MKRCVATEGSVRAKTMLTDDEGVKKMNILTKTEKRRPKKGDCVTCEYVGSLKSSGKEFDSGTLTFTLGNEDVIKGFEIAVFSMSLEEKSTFSVSYTHLTLPTKLAV